MITNSIVAMMLAFALTQGSTRLPSDFATLQKISIEELQLKTTPTLIAAVGIAYAQGESIAESNLRANVPDEKHFDKFLKRDLEQYFKDSLQKTVSVEYQLLRKGPTQTGIAFPKFYAWVTIRDGSKVIDQGAVRVAAIEKKNFDVTDFVSLADIKEAPLVLDRIFPKPVVDAIRERVAK